MPITPFEIYRSRTKSSKIYMSRTKNSKIYMSRTTNSKIYILGLQIVKFTL